MGVSTASLMPKSVSFSRIGDQLCMVILLLCTFLWWNCSVYILGDHDDFPCYTVIQHLPNWVEDLLFLITN